MIEMGAVAIGRNEGQRLRLCLESLAGKVRRIVYVDSGSTDGSVEMARGLGVEVVELDMSIPFTAARARNAGLERLRELEPSLEYVHFFDGDCEVAEGWLETAMEAIESDEKYAAVWGRRRERHPEATIYNKLTDLEWVYSWPYGRVTICGGDVLMRIGALDDVNGFNPSLIAGEEPELCYRLRQKGWVIYRVDAEMTQHDAAMTKFGQWWKRAVRAGHAWAEGAWMYGHEPEHYCVRDSVRIWGWGFFLPLLALVIAPFTKGLSLLIFVAYPVLAVRIQRYIRSKGAPSKDAWLLAFFSMLSKFPSVLGQMKFLSGKLMGKKSVLIEYK